MFLFQQRQSHLDLIFDCCRAMSKWQFRKSMSQTFSIVLRWGEGSNVSNVEPVQTGPQKIGLDQNIPVDVVELGAGAVSLMTLMLLLMLMLMLMLMLVLITHSNWRCRTEVQWSARQGIRAEASCIPSLGFGASPPGCPAPTNIRINRTKTSLLDVVHWQWYIVFFGKYVVFVNTSDIKQGLL